MHYTLQQRAIEVHKAVASERKTMSDLSNNNIMKSIEKNVVRKRACVEYLRVNCGVMKVIRGLQPFPIKLSMKKLHLKLTYFNKNMHA